MIDDDDDDENDIVRRVVGCSQCAPQQQIDTDYYHIIYEVRSTLIIYLSYVRTSYEVLFYNEHMYNTRTIHINADTHTHT